MSLAQDDEVIEALAPNRSDRPFSEAILPRCQGRYRFVPDAHSTNSAQGDVAINAIAIPD